MTEVTAPGVLRFAVLVALATGAAFAGTRRIRFASDVAPAWLRLAMGAAAAPFVLGLAGVIALGALRDASHQAHYWTVAGMLAAAMAASLVLPAAAAGAPDGQTPTRWRGFTLAFGSLLAAFALLLVVHALAFPLMQSDALEYALAGRWLYQARDLAAYPPLNPVEDPSGFYGPWTHPPLYAALIYLANVSQEGADAPGLMRLLSPWALLASAGVLVALAGRRSRSTGLLAALFLIATPLLFLGTDSAQLDAFTVAGLTLSLLGCVTIDLDDPRGACALGALVGLGMWAHSQTVLLLPLTASAVVLLAGPARWRAWSRQLSLVIGCALLVGAWPYVGNLLRAGALVSDNPAVYAMPGMDWVGYFRSERHLESAAARVQYGILKGWTALDAFGLGFWCMTLGVVVTLRRWRTDAARAGPDHRLALACLAMLGCYFGGTILSTVAGIDVMIKNERYLLMIAPCVAILAAIGIGELAGQGTGSRRARWTRSGVLAGVSLMFLAELPVLWQYRAGRLGLSVRDVGLAAEAKLERWDPYLVARAVARDTARGKVLTLKPSDMYYAGRKMVSFLDPRLLPFYRERDPVAAFRLLRDAGVELIHVPSYANPPQYNTVLAEVLADPRLAALAVSRGGYQVYRLPGTPSSERVACAPVAVGPDTLPWTWNSALLFGGSKQLLHFSASGGAVVAGRAPRPPSSILPRERRTTLSSPGISLGARGAREFRLALSLTGRGFAHVLVQQLGRDGSAISTEELGGTYVRSARTYARRLLALPDARELRIHVEYGGQHAVGIDMATLAPICGSPP